MCPSNLRILRCNDLFFTILIFEWRTSELQRTNVLEEAMLEKVMEADCLLKHEFQEWWMNFDYGILNSAEKLCLTEIGMVPFYDTY